MGDHPEDNSSPAVGAASFPGDLELTMALPEGFATFDDQPRDPLAEGRGEGSEEAKKARAAKAAKRNTERNFRNLQQCLLGENLDMVKNYHRQNDNLFKYQTFRQINGQSHQIVNKLRGVSRIEEFLNVRTAVLSLLQPKIRIYKVLYEEGQRNPGQKGGSVPSRVPRYKEIKFSDSFGRDAASSTDEYMKYETTRPNWRNVGLNYFNFKQIGRSWGALEPNIQCEMKIYSKGLKDLLATSPGTGKPGARYIDLLLFPEPAKTRDTEQPNPKHYEIKVFIGYSKPSSSAIKNIVLSPSEREFLKNIEKFNFMITLTMHTYNFNIAETGETTTTINFWGRIGTVTGGTTDVFDNSMVVKEGSGTKVIPKYQSGLSSVGVSNLKTLLSKIIQAKKNPDLKDAPEEDLGRLLLENNLFRDLYKEGFEETIGGDFGPEEVEKVLDKITSRDGAAIFNQQLKRAGAGLRNEVYKSFMLQILDGSGRTGDTRLFAISVNKENLDRALGVINQSALARKNAASKERRKEIQEETSNAIGLASQSVRIGRPTDITAVKESVNAIELRAQENVSDPTAEQESQEGRLTIEDAAKASLITSKTKGDRYEFYFLYIGDIIELAAKNSGMFAVIKDDDPVFSAQSYNRREYGTDYGLTNVRFLLGPVEYNGDDGKIKRINLAEFPISFDLFRVWFLEKIVREDRTKMTFKQFLGSLITNLVLPAMGADCLSPVKLGNVQFQNLFMTLPGTSSDVANNSKETSFNTEELLPLKRKIHISRDPEFDTYVRQVQIPRPHGSLIKNSYDYQLVQTSGYKKITSRKGNCNEDMKDGIYHFFIGSDRGLLKNMKFTKINIPFQQERMSLLAIKEGANQLQQLSFTFNCKLELVGNTLFMPGMHFYANPSFAGLGDPQKKGTVSHQLNLGGYFLILETSLKITPGQFTTTVDGVFVGHGKVKV